MRVLAAVIRDGDRYLLCRRPRHKRHGGLWEFPGGKLQEGENFEDSARREMMEELGVAVTAVGEPLFARRDGESEFVIVFVPVQISGAPRALEHDEIAWVRASQVTSLDLAPTDRVFWETQCPAV